MNSSSEKFIDMISSFVNNKELVLTSVSMQEWEEINLIAGKHKLEMAVYETVYRTKAFQSMPEELKCVWKQRVKLGTVTEIRKMERFFEAYGVLKAAGILALVLKGAVCRFLYHKPYARSSGDEDLWVKKQDVNKCCKILKELSFQEVETKEGNVRTFNDTFSGLHLEIHIVLFGEGLKVYDMFNKWFEGAFDNAVEVSVGEHLIETMHPTDHLLYLLAHWIKHFIGPGVGIRQISDLSLFINRYGEEVDWQLIWLRLQAGGFDVLCANVLEIGMLYFGLDRKYKEYQVKSFESVEPMLLLADVLDAGIYGSSSISRLHSSSITLDAVQGKPGRLHVLFPAAENLQGRYRFLQFCPWLLPAAWIHRLLFYGVEVVKNKQGDNSPVESIAIGNERVELLKKYRVLK